MSTGFARVAVLGLGLIGGSILQTVRRTGIEAVGYDVDPAAVEAASTDGFAVAPSTAAAVRGADLIVLAMPLPAVREAAAALRGHLAHGAVVTDVGTLKQPVVDAVRAELPGVSFVGGHPLAGVEDTGWAAARPAMFRDASWSLVLEPDTVVDDWLRLASFVCDIGARPVPTTAVDQDAAVARVIGLPHVLAEALALTGLAGGPLGLTLAAGSYMSGSRVARTPPELVTTWCDGNPALPGALDDAIGYLVQARDALRGGGSVLPLADAGHAARINWEHRHVEPVELAADRAALVAHGRRGGWITAVLQEHDGPRLLGMRPA